MKKNRDNRGKMKKWQDGEGEKKRYGKGDRRNAQQDLRNYYQ